MGRYRLAPPQECDNRYLMDYMAYHSLKEIEGGWSWKFDPGFFSLTIAARHGGAIKRGVSRRSKAEARFSMASAA